VKYDNQIDNHFQWGKG